MTSINFHFLVLNGHYRPKQAIAGLGTEAEEVESKSVEPAEAQKRI